MTAARNTDDLTPETIRQALSYVDPTDRRTWVRMAMAVKSELGEAGFGIWNEWSARDAASYDERAARSTWKSAKISGSHGSVTIATLIWEATQAGFSLAEHAGERVTPDEVKRREQERAERIAQERKEQREAAKASAEMANQVWEQAQPAESHPYLTRKGVKAHGLRIGRWPLFKRDAYEPATWLDDVLLVPMMDGGGRIHSLQGILPERREALGTDKLYLKNGVKQGHYLIIGELPQAGGVVCFCEGYATGATIHELTGWCVVVVFDRTNFAPVMSSMRDNMRQVAFVIAADNDQWTEGNPGVTDAQAAAKACGAKVLVPEFSDTSTRPTDFNDLATIEGREVARAQLMGAQIVAPVAANDNAVTTSPGAVRLVDYTTPLIDVKTGGKPMATIENVQEICRRLGVVVRYNVITKEEELLIPGETFSVDNKANASFSKLESECAKFMMPTDKLGGFVTYLADQNLFNPVATWITSKPWDGVERVRDLCATIVPVEEKRLKDGRRLSDILITRWLISAVAAAFNHDGVSAHGMLVLQGPQYLGKTMWLKQLAPPELNIVQDGMMLRPDDRDNVKQVCSFWLVELGELDATFRKSDIAALKSFLTRKQDVLRRAYARKESTFARRTVFFGSVNPREFLHDTTGNRRYWTIECQKIDLEAQKALDMQQVWAEVLAMYERGETHFLQPEEMDALNNSNEQFMAIDPIEERIQTRLEWDCDRIHWAWKTATEILIMVGVDRPTQSDATKCATFIRKLNQCTLKRSNGKSLLLCPPRVRGFTGDGPF